MRHVRGEKLCGAVDLGVGATNEGECFEIVKKPLICKSCVYMILGETKELGGKKGKERKGKEKGRGLRIHSCGATSIHYRNRGSTYEDNYSK